MQSPIRLCPKNEVLKHMIWQNGRGGEILENAGEAHLKGKGEEGCSDLISYPLLFDPKVLFCACNGEKVGIFSSAF